MAGVLADTTPRLRATAAQWDAQPREVRTRLRERYAAWRALDAVSVEAIESAVQAFAHRTPQEQATLRAQFDALDPIAQRGWLLGPAIGGDYPKLHALLAQLPEAQHAPMLRVLRRMDNAERADLTVLAQRVPPQDRPALCKPCCRPPMRNAPRGCRCAWRSERAAVTARLERDVPQDAAAVAHAFLAEARQAIGAQARRVFALVGFERARVAHDVTHAQALAAGGGQWIDHVVHLRGQKPGSASNSCTCAASHSR